MKVFRYVFLLICLVVSPIFILAQDLGSANDLFRTSNPKTKNTPAKKKPAPKPKTTAKSRSSKSAVKTSTNRQPTAINKSAPSKKSPKPKRTPEETELAEDVIITIPENSAETARKEELFENAIDEGNNARDARNYVKAESAYKRALSIKPNDFRSVYGLGNVYSDGQRWEEAERAYREAIKLSPDGPESYVAISVVLTQPITGKDLSARYAEAEQLARKAIALDPENPIAFDQLGVALELSGKIRQETKSAYQKAIKLDPEFALAYAHLGRLLRRTGQINESAAAYRKAMQFAADMPTMILVADVMQSQQRYTDSEQLLRRALREDPKNPTALYLLGRALMTRSEYKEAEYNAWKIFYERNKQAAYLTDVTRGTTPIYQEIPNLSSAKSAYGNIVYRKAPSFLRQAEFYLGEDKFQTAVRQFLKKHEFANAEWTDLVKEFELASKQDLKDWANVWVTKRGMPIITYDSAFD